MTSDSESAALPYRPCAGIMLINAQKSIFVGERLDGQDSGIWQMPQGGIDPGEEPMAAAMREMEEEIGTRNAEIIAETPDWLTYDLPPDLRGKVWCGRYRGQKQKWFLLRFLGTDAEINLQTEHPEFSAWKWTDADALVAEVIAFKRDIYRQIRSAFADYLT